jgi:hypothetical protein
MNRAARRRAAAIARHHPGQGYVDRILRGFHPSRGRYDCMVEHQRGCAMRHGGPCTCVPSISITEPDGSIVMVDEHGNPRKATRQ